MPTPPPAIPDYPTGIAVQLPATGTWPASIHRFDPDTCAALRAAEAAGRPLLIRGEPGTGKSQTARAAAAKAGRPFLSVVIDGRTEAQDLLWHYDAVGRLSDAQVGGQGALPPERYLSQSRRQRSHGSRQGQGALPPERYLSPGPLWWAYHWESAEKQWEHRKQGERPEHPPGWTAEKGTVLLIDEIDKADPDLPNAFLELLGNRGFTVPYQGNRVVRGQRPPLVVITTNEERELPNAFLRRCLVLTLRLPSDLKPWLVELGTLHLTQLELGDHAYPAILEEAADLLIGDRAQAQRDQTYAPGLAEYLDLVIALARLGGKDEARQRELLGLVAGFALRKSLSE